MSENDDDPKELGDETPGGESPDDAPPGGGEEKPQLTKVGDEEFSADDLAALVADGKGLRSFKEKFPNVDIEGMAPEFTRLTQLIKDPEKLLEYAQKQYPDRFPAGAPQAGAPDAASVKEAVGWLRQQGFVSKDEVTQIVQQMQEDIAYDSMLKGLAKELDGSDGRPKFDIRAVLTHGKTKGIYDPKAAYNDMHESALREWYAAKKAEKKPKAPGTERGGAGLQLPKDGKLEFGSKAMSDAMDRVLEEGSND